jgi:hypothetical protein
MPEFSALTGFGFVLTTSLFVAQFTRSRWKQTPHTKKIDNEGSLAIEPRVRTPIDFWAGFARKFANPMV